MATLSHFPVHVRCRVLILARSFKPGGWCVAGKVIGSSRHGRWIRLVGRDTTEGVSSDCLRLDRSGEIASPLDLLDVSLVSYRPYLFQRENFELGGDGVQRVSHLGTAAVLDLVDQPQALWRSRYVPKSDRMPLYEAQRELDSLRLIRCRGVKIYPLEVEGKRRKFRAQFVHQGVAYDLSVTDPAAQRLVAGMPGGCIIPDALLTLSLGVPFHDYCYKLVAGLIPVNG